MMSHHSCVFWKLINAICDMQMLTFCDPPRDHAEKRE